jgi:hypothetical protein
MKNLAMGLSALVGPPAANADQLNNAARRGHETAQAVSGARNWVLLHQI